MSDMEILPLLSAYRDGELEPSERVEVERALAQSPELRARLADLEALSAAMQGTLQRRAEEADLRGFTARVMARVEDERRPSLLERLREMFAARPLQLATVGVAILVLAVAVVVGSTAVDDPGPDAPPTIADPAPPERLERRDQALAMERPAGPAVQVHSVEAAEGHEVILLAGDGMTLIYVR